mmetsp:Transcript_7420/g.15293  ORF Transcript_7420/g.15293 Transcript_7420/m.15293 type:complete len:681 (+) Transcript_7420:230-2272(+)
MPSHPFQKAVSTGATGHIILSAVTSSIVTFCIMQWYHTSIKKKRKRSVQSQNKIGNREEENIINIRKNLQNTDGSAKDAISVHSTSSCISQEDKNEFVKMGFLASIGEAEFEADDNKKPNRRLSSMSFSGNFLNVDGVDRRGSATSVDSTDETDLTEESRTCDGTSVKVLSEGYYEDDTSIMQAKEFDANVLAKLTTLEESHMLLRRTRAVSALASRLMGAPDEQACFEEVTKLLVPLFRVDRASYALLVDSEHFLVRNVTVNHRKHAIKMGFDAGDRGVVKPLKGTAVGSCAQTLKQHYTPRTKDSPFETHKLIYSMGINSVLATPILVDGNKFAGCIVVSLTIEDGFKVHDRILISDIAAMLGANIYSKRMKQAAEKSNKMSREMLHAMIPSKVIEKIECFWDESSEAYLHRHSCNSVGIFGSETNMDDSEHSRSFKKEKSKRDLREKIDFLNQMNREDSQCDNFGVVVDSSKKELGLTSQALYAENVDNVVILFTDIVGFSKMSLDMKPIEVVDMLQNLFCRFDNLCDKHGVQKLETIGDAYICTAGLFVDGNVNDAARNVLNLAKDMIRETRKVRLPRTETLSQDSFVSPQIRVGIHVGNVTCGVLGQRLPKFTVFGSAVNLAARMEQTSRPSRIHVTEDFHKLVSFEEDYEWDDCSETTVKNMGKFHSYLLKEVL